MKRKDAEVIANSIAKVAKILSTRIVAVEKALGIKPVNPQESKSPDEYRVGDTFTHGGVRWKCVGPRRFRNIDHFPEGS